MEYLLSGILLDASFLAILYIVLILQKQYLHRMMVIRIGIYIILGWEYT